MKQLSKEDQKWIEGNKIVANKLLEMQQRIDELEKENADWRNRALNSEKVIGELNKENAELKTNVKSEKDLEDEIDLYQRTEIYRRG